MSVRSVWEESYVPQEVLDELHVSAHEFQDTIDEILYENEDSACGLVTASKSWIPTVSAVPGQANLTLSYGKIPIRLSENDSFESLAVKYFGDPDRAIDIAAYNGVASLGELRPGDTLYIPILNKIDANPDNQIYARQGDHDTYGRDISLSPDGYIEASPTGDFKIKSGVDNLSQAILLRLRENVNKRIRLNLYGLRNSIADPVAGVAYILSSIEITVLADPRVQAIDDTQFRGIGDGLFVDIFYRDKNGLYQRFSRTIGSA
jgi:hypothetical protein